MLQETYPKSSVVQFENKKDKKSSFLEMGGAQKNAVIDD